MSFLIRSIFLFLSFNAFASTWICKDVRGLEAKLSYSAEPHHGRLLVDGITVTFQESGTLSTQVDIPMNQMFDSLRAADAYLEKEQGASFSYISYESGPEKELPSTFLFPKYIIVFSGFRNDLLVHNPRSSQEFYYTNCKKL